MTGDTATASAHGGRRPPTPGLVLLFHARITLGPVQEVGDTPSGRRRIIPITGGAVEGPKLQGRVLPGGADWQLVRADGVALLEAHYTVEASDGALIYVRNVGLRSAPADVAAALAVGADIEPSRYYFRTVPRFEAGQADYAWLNTLIAIGSGARLADAVLIDFYAVT